MPRPNIQIDDEVREITEDEYQTLLATGWTEEGPADVVGDNPDAQHEA